MNPRMDSRETLIGTIGTATTLDLSSKYYCTTNSETEPSPIIHPAVSHRNQGNLRLQLSLIDRGLPARSLDRHNQHVRVGSLCNSRHRILRPNYDED